MMFHEILTAKIRQRVRDFIADVRTMFRNTHALPYPHCVRSLLEALLVFLGEFLNSIVNEFRHVVLSIL